MPLFLTLSIISYVSRIKRSNPGNGVVFALHHDVVANEKGAFVSLSTTVANFTYFTTTTTITTSNCSTTATTTTSINTTDTYYITELSEAARILEE